MFLLIAKDCTERLSALPCPRASLFRAANTFRVTWSERVFSQIRQRNALTEIAWEDAEQGTEQGLGMANECLP